MSLLLAPRKSFARFIRDKRWEIRNLIPLLPLGDPEEIGSSQHFPVCVIGAAGLIFQGILQLLQDFKPIPALFRELPFTEIN